MIEIKVSNIQKMIDSINDVKKFDELFESILTDISSNNFNSKKQNISVFYNFKKDKFTTISKLGETVFATDFNIKLYSRNQSLIPLLDKYSFKNKNTLSIDERNEVKSKLEDFIYNKIKSKIIKDKSLLFDTNYTDSQLIKGYKDYEEMTDNEKDSLIHRYIWENYRNENKIQGMSLTNKLVLPECVSNSY